MSRFTRWIASLITIVWVAVPVSAQSVVQAGSRIGDCAADTAAAGAFDHCVLTLERSKLTRGLSGEVVTRERFLHPIAMSQYVIGDSARHYAQMYERDTRWAMRLALFGGGLMVSSYAAGHMCSAPVCSSSGRRTSRLVAGATGAALFGIAIPLKIHARHLGYQALSFSNASLKH